MSTRSDQAHLKLHSAQQQAGGSGYAKTGAVGLQTDTMVSPSWTADVNTAVFAGWTGVATADIDLRPTYIRLKPCVFNASY